MVQYVPTICHKLSAICDYARLASWTFLIGLQSRLLKSRHGRQFCLFVRILVVILGVCPAQAIAQEKIRIAPSSPGLSAWPGSSGGQRKIFAGEGLDAEVIVMRTNVGIAALVTGSIDFTTAGGSAMRGAVNGAPLKMVLNITKKADLWVLSQKNILRVEDLRGKMIGVGGNWGTQFYLVLEALKHYGADKDVQLVSTGDVANGYLSLQQGSMPAVALTPPYSILAKRQGYRDLVRTGDVVSVSPTTGLVTTKDKIEREPQRIRRVIRAVMKAVDYAKGRKAETVQFITEAIQDGKGSCRFRLRRGHGDTESDALADRPRNPDRAESHRRADKNKNNRPSVGHGGLFNCQASGAGVESVINPQLCWRPQPAS